MSARKRTIVVAGATGNVGAAASRELARRGFRVVMLGRNGSRLSDKAAALSQGIRAEEPDAAPCFEVEVVDLADLDDVRACAARIGERHSEITALVLSVVTMRDGGPRLLDSGNEAMFATNVLGPFLLASLLHPLLEAAQGIVVHVVAPFQKEIDWDDLQGVRAPTDMVAYERSKACNRIVAGEMARRFSGRVVSMAFDPGFVIDLKDPALMERWPGGWTGWIWKLFARVAAQPPSSAGRAMAELLTRSPDFTALNGRYFRGTLQRRKPDPLATDPDLGQRLWSRLEDLTKA